MGLATGLEAKLRAVTDLHNSIKFIKYIAWDIAITSTDYKIIEANDVSDVDGFQIHEPLMNNTFNKKFYSTT